MSNIKTLKFKNGKVTEADPNTDSPSFKSVKLGGAFGTEFSKAHVDTLTGGESAEASGLHQHDGLYYRKSDAVDESSGAEDANKPVKTNHEGKIDASLLDAPIGRTLSEERRLSTAEILAKTLLLSSAPSPDVRVKLFPEGGIPLIQGIHFSVFGATINWAGYEVESVFEADDLIVVEYFVEAL